VIEENKSFNQYKKQKQKLKKLVTTFFSPDFLATSSHLEQEIRPRF